jgi:hypothetical protein
MSPASCKPEEMTPVPTTIVVIPVDSLRGRGGSLCVSGYSPGLNHPNLTWSATPPSPRFPLPRYLLPRFFPCRDLRRSGNALNPLLNFLRPRIRARRFRYRWSVVEVCSLEFKLILVNALKRFTKCKRISLEQPGRFLSLRFCVFSRVQSNCNSKAQLARSV